MKVAEYIERICRAIPEVGHTDNEMHFVDLNDDKRQSGIAQRLKYPYVMIVQDGERWDNDGEKVVRHYSLSVMTHVKDTGNYQEVAMALSLCREILMTIFAMLMEGRRARKERWLTTADWSGEEIVDIENVDNAQWGKGCGFSLTECPA